MDNSNQGDELTLKEFVAKAIDYLKEIARRWIFIVVCIIVGVGIFYLKHKRTEVIFPAEIKFIVDNDDSSSGMIGNLLGQFGIRKPSKNNPYKILEIARSNLIMRKVLEGTVAGKTLANQILETYSLNERWSKDYPELENYTYDPKEINNKTANLAFIKLKSFVWGAKNEKTAKLKISLDEDSGIFYIQANTKDEDLSLSLVNETYENVKFFFENEIMENQLSTIDILNFKVDSLDNLRRLKTFEYSKFEDQNRNSISFVAKSKKELLRQDIQAVSITYTELLKNKELAEISLNDRKSTYMKIDSTLSPIIPERSSLLISIILGIFVGLIIGAFLVIFRKLFRELLK